MTIKDIYFYMVLIKDALSVNDQDGPVPIGCVLVSGNEYILKVNGLNIDHCELLALKEGIGLGWDIRKCTIIISCEPCSMCLTALCLMKIKNIYFGCYNKVFGGLGGNFNLLNINQSLYKPNILGGFMEEYWSQLLVSFFHCRR
jgi:tRNA-specific adenosine deaminase 2